jgi:hypothetical protein
MWYVTCYKDGGSLYSAGGSILGFSADGFCFIIVAMHDQAKIDKHIKKNKKHINQLNTSKWRLQTLNDQLEFNALFLIFFNTLKYRNNRGKESI